MSYTAYSPLNLNTVANYLAALPVAVQIMGGKPDAWKVREVGDGNLNLVFVVEGPSGGLVLKQALPYVRLVGESWPLPLNRAFFENNALRIQDQHAPGLTPKVHHADNDMALIVMEYLSPHIILRKGLIKKIYYPKAAKAIAEFMARTLFHTSMLASSAEEHKARIALFAPNTALCKITEDLVFTDPYRTAELNRWTKPFLDSTKSAFEQDTALKITVQEKKWQFLTEAQSLIHGDLHTGSVMVTADDTRVIDPEFAFVGPMGFDVGAVLANFLLSYFSHRGQVKQTAEDPYCTWLLEQVRDLWSHFEMRFVDEWKNQATGEVFGQGLFDGPEGKALESHRLHFMQRLFQDALGFAGCKMIRRIFGLAHVEDLESIEDLQLRARCETLALAFARDLVLNARHFYTIADVIAAAENHAKEVKI